MVKTGFGGIFHVSSIMTSISMYDNYISDTFKMMLI